VEVKELGSLVSQMGMKIEDISITIPTIEKNINII